VGTAGVIDRDAYCRDLERHLCRKNDGHLIRIVGPAFDRVMAWAEQGIPLKIAELGIDRYFERYYRKGPRRRPVRIEFCEAEVLDAFDEWRRAVGLGEVGPDAEGGPFVETPGPVPRTRRSLPTHIERVLARLTVLRGSDKLGPRFDGPLQLAIGQLDAARSRAALARGAARDAILADLARIDADLTTALRDALGADERAACERDADAELAPFKSRMTGGAYDQARDAAVVRLVRERFGVPPVRF
jgi:hypothetical protein